MTLSAANQTGILEDAQMPRRDWILLPLLSLTTVVLLAGSMLLLARQRFPASDKTLFDCLVLNDPSTGERGIPNSKCSEKMGESQPIEYRFNGSGYRSDVEFRSKDPETYRIVMVGTSVALGMHVPREETFASLLPLELSRHTGRKVELHNEGWGGTPHGVALRFNEVLADKPDMVLWILTYWDIANVSFVLPQPAPALDRRGRLVRIWSSLRRDFTTESVPDALHGILERSVEKLSPSSVLMLRHYLYQSQSQYVNSYLIAGDDESGFLKTKPSAAWLSRLRQFNIYAADIEKRAHEAGVPLVAVLVPNRAQVAMISMGEWPTGYDPYKLGDELRSAITSSGGTYLDILPAFRYIPNPEQNYFAVDGHPTANGHAILSSLLAKELVSGAVPSLRVTTQAQVSSEQRR
jgi:hypothetical protein